MHIVGQRLEGDFTAIGGDTDMTYQHIVGDIDVGVGAIVNCIVTTHTGNVINAGILNGVIAGIRYGSWVDGTEIISSGIRNGSIQGSFTDDCLRLTIDTTTDSIDDILCSYHQLNNNSRAVGFRVIDADNSAVYFEDTNTDTGVGIKYFDIVGSPVATLPTNQVVNLLIQAERVSGAQTSDASCQITFTRTP